MMAGMRQRLQIACVLLAACVLAVSCTSSPADTTCYPDRVAEQPSIPGEAQARATAGFEAWTLWFTNTDLPAGQPITLPVGEDAKVVWSMTGKGDFSVAAQHADGSEMQLDWGPDPHSGSNWDAPGDEWGTGWTFTKTGCWTFTAVRGSDSAQLTVLIAEG